MCGPLQSRVEISSTPSSGEGYFFHVNRRQFMEQNMWWSQKFVDKTWGFLQRIISYESFALCISHCAEILLKKFFNSNSYLYQFHDFCLSCLSSAMVGNEAIGGFIQSKIRKRYFLSFQNFWCSPDFHFTRVTVQKIISAWTTGMQNAWFLKFWRKWHP